MAHTQAQAIRSYEFRTPKRPKAFCWLQQKRQAQKGQRVGFQAQVTGKAFLSTFCLVILRVQVDPLKKYAQQERKSSAYKSAFTRSDMIYRRSLATKNCFLKSKSLFSADECLSFHVSYLFPEASIGKIIVKIIDR